MGAERLNGRVAALSLLLLLGGCHRAGPTGSSGPTSSRAVAVGKHLQVVRAMTMAERTAIVGRFQARNAPSPEAWSFNEDALEGVVVVDPFRGFLRRGQRRHALGARGVSPDGAAAAARAFVEKNADLLGLPSAIVHALAEDRSSAGDRWSIRFNASYPSKGYEAFHEVDNKVDLEVLVADDGVVTSFVNRSRIHPALQLDLHPRLAEDSPLVVQQLIGREVHAYVAPSGASDTKNLPRIPIGVVRPVDITKVELTIYPSPGPQLAYVTYQLAYLVVGGRQSLPDMVDPFRSAAVFMFGFVVDADTGDVLAENLRDLPLPEEESP